MKSSITPQFRKLNYLNSTVNTLSKKYSQLLSVFYLILILILIVVPHLKAQNVPVAPNKIDNNKLRQEKWVILYDKDWKVVQDTAKMQYYRRIQYKDDLPQDTTRDYYRSGKIQWKGKLLKDRPKEVMEGKCVWYYESGRVQQIGWYEKGKLLKSEGYHPSGIKNEWEYLNQQGGKLYQQSKYSKALTIFQKAKAQAEKEFGKTHENYASACNNLAGLYQIQGMYAKAEPLYREAKGICAQVLGKNHPAYASACNNLAELYKVRGLYARAEPLFLKAKNIRAKILGINHPAYAISCNHLARLYQAQGFYEKAEPLFLKAKGIYAQVLGKKHPSYAIVCNDVALLYQVQGLYIKAESLLLEAKGIYAQVLGKKHPAYATACNNVALLYQAQGLYAKAEPLYLEANNIRAQVLGTTHTDYAITCNNLAELYHLQGVYAKAEPLFLKAKEIRAKVLGTNHPVYATSCNNVAALYKLQGLYAKAELLYQEAKNIRAKILGKTHPAYAGSCNHLAGLYRTQGEYAKAELLYREAKGIYAQVLGKDHPTYAITCNNLAELYHSQGLYAKSKSLYLEAKNICAKVLGKSHPDYALFCNNLALLYDLQGLYAQAKPLYLEAKAIRTKVLGKSHPAYATSCNNLAILYWSQHSYHKSFYLLQEVFPNLNQQIKQNLAVANENQRRKFLQVNINYNYRAYHSFMYDYIDSLGIAQSDSVLSVAYQNHLLTKSLLFNSTQKTKERIYNSKDTATIKLYNQFIETRTRYNKALELTKEKRKLNGISLEALNEKADSLEKVLARRSTAFAKNLEEYQPHTWQEVQQKLQPNEAAIEIIRFRWYNKKWTDTVYYAALIVTPHSKFPYPVFLKNGNELEGKGYRFYRKANTKLRAEDNASYNLFWQPIHQQLKKLYPNVKKVFVSLDGVYNKINLETLRNPQTGKYLGKELDIRLVSNTKDLLNRDKPTIKSASKVIGLFGFPDYRVYNQVDTLPVKVKQKMLSGTAKEVNAIYKQLKPSFIPQKFTHQAASEENIKSLKKPKVLHLATHGFFMADIKPKRTNQFQLLGRETHLFIENPLLRSGLYWAGADATLNQKSRPDSVKENGVLTAQEVLNMDLDSTQLVVLSACETGRGKIQNGEGVYGLQRAFLSAGAKNVLMSLWKVDDMATQYFMQYFYESWAKDENVRKAYRYAQSKLRVDYPSPYYWGAFVLVGR